MIVDPKSLHLAGSLILSQDTARDLIMQYMTGKLIKVSKTLTVLEGGDFVAAAIHLGMNRIRVEVANDAHTSTHSSQPVPPRPPNSNPTT